MEDKNEVFSRSLKASFTQGVFSSAVTGFVQEYFTPFLLLLGGGAGHVGFLNAFSNLTASIVQVKSADIAEKLVSRKRMISFFAFSQSVILALIAFFAWMGKVPPFIFIGLVVLFAVCGALAVPAWGSLMSDLVQKHKRGEYFGWRSRVLGIVTAGAMFLAGLILHYMKKVNIFYGFVIIFTGAFILRIISWLLLRRIDEPPFKNNRENYFSFWQFIRRLKKSNFTKFVVFVSLVSFSVNVASPFFAVLMLEELKFSYLLYTFITLTATFTTYVTIGRWGRMADRIGNLKIIKFTAAFVGIIPLLWMISRNPLFLFFAQIFSGFMWAGFNLCSSNFIFDSVSSEKRTRCIAYFNAVNGVALCVGALLGVFLLPSLPPIFGYKILTLFLISAGLRIITGIFLPGRLKEVRPVENIKSNEMFFSIVGVRPVLGIERKTLRY